MPGRIITLQRQARELGRLRTGTFEKPKGAKGRPVRSETWIVTSPAEHYVEAAAAEWGGQVEKWQPQGNGAPQYRVITDTTSLDAILPPGDPLSQAYELWNRGGCVRRCDGESEDMSGGPCLCRQQFGDDFGSRDDIPADEVCKVTTRLNVMLPAMPDLGAWRCETHSYYAANEIAGSVDTIRGLIGPQALVPVRLRIEQRTRVAGGKTKHYPVVVVELRGPTAGQLLAGDTSGIAMIGAAQRPVAEITAPPAEDDGAAVEQVDWHAQVPGLRDLDALRALWKAAGDAGALDDNLKAALTTRATELSGEGAGEGPEPVTSPEDDNPPPSGDTPEAEKDGERAALWQRIVGADPMKTTTEVRDGWLEYSGGQPFDEAPIADCRAYAEQETAS